MSATGVTAFRICGGYGEKIPRPAPYCWLCHTPTPVDKQTEAEREYQKKLREGGKLPSARSGSARRAADSALGMGALISVAFHSGQNIDMDSAYQKALWGSPTHREALLTSKRRVEERQAAKEKKAHAAKAAKAGSSVAGSPGGAEPAAPVGSVRQELEKAMAASS